MTTRTRRPSAVQRRWHWWPAALLLLFLYTVGIADCIFMLSHYEAYYAYQGYGPAVVDYFTDYPWYDLLFWLGNLLPGLLAPLALLVGKPQAAALARLSAASDAVLLALTALFRNRIGVLGLPVFLFDLLILALTAWFAWYCRRQFPS